MKTPLTRKHTLLIPFAASLGGLAVAQGVMTYPEIEPNSTKTEATVVHCLHDADMLVGTTIGDVNTPGDPSLNTEDTFRVQTCALPLGLYRHRLVITSMTPGQTGILCGRNQKGGVIGPYETPVQLSASDGIPQQFNQWYGFGKAEEVYFRISGTPATTAQYSVILNTTPIAPVDLEQPLVEGNIVFTTVGQGHDTNTDLWLYNAAFEPILLAGNDDRLSPLSMQSFLRRNLTPGTYFLALTQENLASDQASPVDDGNRSGNVVDFPNVVIGSDSTKNINVSFAVTDSYHTFAVPAMKQDAFEVLWFRFLVLPHPATMHPFCAGDGHAASTPCPCGNDSPVNDHGCAGFPNVNGAYLDASGLPSVFLDSVLLRASDMPVNATCLFFQGNAMVNNGMGYLFNDGLRCVGGTVIRLGVKTVDGFGDAVYGYQQPGDMQVHVAGLVPPGGGPFFYQVWYRNNTGLCGNRSNTSNGLAINWAP